MLFEKEQLIDCIQSDIEIVAIWGAFQIIKLDNEQIKDFLPYFLNSQFVDIQDAGLAKIADLKLEGYTADIIRIFRGAEGQLKYTAAFALSAFPNDITRALLHKWFDQLNHDNQSTRLEYDAAVYSQLNFDRQQNFQPVLNTLRSFHSDVVKSSVLFTNLLQFCESEQDYTEVIDQYFILRDQFSDAELTLHLVDSLVDSELRDWWAANLSKGYTISSIYNQCYILLGLDEDLTDRHYWNELESALGEPESLHKNSPNCSKALIDTVQQWIGHLLAEDEDDQNLLKLKWIIDGFSRNENLFKNTIPKIVELEVQFILSVPLFIVLEKAFSGWMQNPAEHVEQIANYYHSTLLIKTNREKILSMFFPEPPQWPEKELVIIHDESPVDVNDNKNDVIWSFYRGELLGFAVPWPTIFPNPDFSNFLTDGLARIYRANFTGFVKAKDKVSIDYALQLFQLRPSKGAIKLIHDHFDYLYQFHTETLYQTLEFLPDASFLNLLLAKYDEGEREISRLLLLISTVFNVELPEDIQTEVFRSGKSGHQLLGMKKPVRLHCRECKSSFQYSAEIIYIDETSILSSNRLTAEAIWVPHGFTCKRCEADLPFELDTTQLDELSQQSRVDRIFKITPETGTHQYGFPTCLIDFPRHQGKIFNPGEFAELISKITKGSSLDEDELKLIWMKQARLMNAMSQWQDCKEALEKVKSMEKVDEEWIFLMGLVSYKLSSFAEARKYFDWILKKYPEDIPQASFTPFVEKARLYVSYLNSKSSKKALFKVIPGKK
ncbi:MAG: hypothetical protein MJE63_21175 [Proteobacteria bacterium]|nr:hypothetical protein [Pseudomonadota bacterium]